MFNTVALEWSGCMETCPKYSRAQPPSFSDKVTSRLLCCSSQLYLELLVTVCQPRSLQAGLEELLSWSLETTRDPATRQYYPGVVSGALWLPFRSHHSTTALATFRLICLSLLSSVMVLQRTSGLTTSPGGGVAPSLGLNDGGRQENCALLTPAWGARWVDWRCVVNKASPIVCACEHSQVTSLNPFVKSKQKAFILEPIFLNMHFEINL